MIWCGLTSWPAGSYRCCSSIIHPACGDEYLFLVLPWIPQPSSFQLVQRKPRTAVGWVCWWGATKEQREERQEATPGSAAANDNSISAAVAALWSELGDVFPLKEEKEEENSTTAFPCWKTLFYPTAFIMTLFRHCSAMCFLRTLLAKVIWWNLH